MLFFGHHHAYRSTLHKHKKLPNKKMIFLVDKSIYIIALFAVAANVPQLLNIWMAKNTEGVSLISWMGFLIGSCFWLWYGILHKEMPIIFINFFLILIQGAIVFGLFINQFNML